MTHFFFAASECIIRHSALSTMWLLHPNRSPLNDLITWLFPLVMASVIFSLICEVVVWAIEKEVNFCMLNH